MVTLSAGELGSTSENNLREITSGMRPVKAGVRNNNKQCKADTT